MYVDNQTHQCPCDVRTEQENQSSSSNQWDDMVKEALQQMIYQSIIASFKGMGNATKNSDDKGGKNVSDAGPISMEELCAAHPAVGEAVMAADATMAEGMDILQQLFGQEINPDTSIYFDEGMQDPDLINLFGGQLPIAGPAPNPNAGATGDRGEPDAVIGGTTAPSNGATGAEETEEPPPAMTTGDYNPIFGDESIYGLAALVLLTTMQNKRNIVANRLGQIEDTNNRVQSITNQISELKAAKSGLEKDGDKTKVDASALQTLANNNLDSTGNLDEDGTDKFFSELGISDGDKTDIISHKPFNEDGSKNIKEIELTKAQIDAVIEKLTSQSEALSTQNQTRNIKLQQQISELQVTTQMTSAIIDQIKTLGSGIAQRI